MSLPVDHSIYGGNFYNIAGNMSLTQAFNSQVVETPTHAPLFTDFGQGEGNCYPQRGLHPNHEFAGVIRAPKTTTRLPYLPYPSHPVTRACSSAAEVGRKHYGSLHAAASRSTRPAQALCSQIPHPAAHASQQLNSSSVEIPEIRHSTYISPSPAPHIYSNRLNQYIEPRSNRNPSWRSNDQPMYLHLEPPNPLASGKSVERHKLTCDSFAAITGSAPACGDNPTLEGSSIQGYSSGGTISEVASFNESPTTLSASRENNSQRVGSDFIPYHNIPPALGPRMDTLQRIEFPNVGNRSERLFRTHYSPPRHRPPITASSHNNSFTVHGNMTQVYLTSHGNSGLDILYRSIAMSAMHDSGERFPEPACHPGTRTEVLADLMAWSADTDRGSPLLWLNGCAGMGKSAVAQAFAGECKKAGCLGASFFFKRGHTERGTWERLFTTLAYQLALSVPALRISIQRAVEEDSLVVAQAAELQFEKLIVGPLKHAPTTRSTPPIIIIDGLDECAEPRAQEQIIQLITKAIHKNELSLRVLIISRPEAHLRDVLHLDATPGIRHLELSAGYIANQDVRLFLSDKLSKLKLKCQARGIDLGGDWPSPKNLDHLVNKACGTFIYATTVIRYIDDRFSHPQTRLNSVLRLDPASAAPLDDLYIQILSALVPERPTLRCILHHYFSRKVYLWLQGTPEQVDLLYQNPRGTTRALLDGLSSILEVTPLGNWRSESYVQSFHASFLDFLCDHRRSGDWCISNPLFFVKFVHNVARLLSNPFPSLHLSFCRSLSTWFPIILSQEDPDQEIITLLQHRALQENLFFSRTRAAIFHDLEGKSRYPQNLTILWSHLGFIASVVEQNPHLPVNGLRVGMPSIFSSTTEVSQVHQIHGRRGPKKPLLLFDKIYASILGASPDLLFVLSSATLLLSTSIAEGASNHILDLYDLSRKVFKPLLRYHRHALTSPLAFVNDPGRAGPLFLDRMVLLERLLLQWIFKVKIFLNGDPTACELPPYEILKLIRGCRYNQDILRELQTLDLSKICKIYQPSELEHKYCHRGLLSSMDEGGIYDAVLYWFQIFPAVPQSTVLSWESQRASIYHCDKQNFSGYH